MWCSIGKQKAELKLYYTNKTFGSSLVRNVIKFLPWQLGHMGAIRGIYTNFDTNASMKQEQQHVEIAESCTSVDFLLRLAPFRVYNFIKAKIRPT